MKGWPQSVRVGIKAIITVGLLIWLINSVKPQSLVESLVGARMAWLAVAVVWVILSMGVSTFKWRLLLISQGIGLSYGELWRFYWQGLFFNNFLPSSIGGDALRIVLCGRASGDTPGATTSVIGERLIATAGIAATGLMGAALSDKTDLSINLLFLILAAVSSFLLVILLAGRLPRMFEKRDGKVTTFLKKMAEHGGRAGAQPGSLVSVFALSVLFQVTVVGVNYAIFQALNVRISWEHALYIIPAASAIAMVPCSINGFGIREGAYIALLAGYHVTAGQALSASLLFGVLVSLCSLYGGLLWMFAKGETQIDARIGTGNIESS